jgi:hypothetical protein
MVGGSNVTRETDDDTWVREHVSIRFKDEERRSHIPQRKNPANVTVIKTISEDVTTICDAATLTRDDLASGEADGHCR